MSERIQHKTPIIGRNCEADGLFQGVIREIDLEDGMKIIVNLEKCKGCCAEAIPALKLGWHSDDCESPEDTRIVEKQWSVSLDQVEGGRTRTFFFKVELCLGCGREKFDEREFEV